MHRVLDRNALRGRPVSTVLRKWITARGEERRADQRGGCARRVQRGRSVRDRFGGKCVLAHDLRPRRHRGLPPAIEHRRERGRHPRRHLGDARGFSRSSSWTRSRMLRRRSLRSSLSLRSRSCSMSCGSASAAISRRRTHRPPPHSRRAARAAEPAWRPPDTRPQRSWSFEGGGGRRVSTYSRSW
jgi:hypothetical protein